MFKVYHIEFEHPVSRQVTFFFISCPLGDYAQVVEDYKRAKRLYGSGKKNQEIFQKYLIAAENHITFLKAELYVKLSELDVPLEEQKTIISNLAILDPKQDVAWDCVLINYNLLIEVTF